MLTTQEASEELRLVINFSKYFLLVLEIDICCESQGKFCESHIGLREKCITVDCVYILRMLIQKILSMNKKLDSFIQMCFDTIVREACSIRYPLETYYNDESYLQNVISCINCLTVIDCRISSIKPLIENRVNLCRPFCFYSL